MPGGGDSVLFFRPGGRSFPLNNCPLEWILTEKFSGLGVSPGGWLPVKVIPAL